MDIFDPVELTAELVSAFVSENALPRGDLAALIVTIHATLVRLGKGEAPETPIEAKEPAVSVRRSITPDYLICLEDGKKFKSLRRHLAALGLTPDAYRAKWGLPRDYPMVAPNYSAKRSALAAQLGLGKFRRKAKTR